MENYDLKNEYLFPLLLPFFWNNSAIEHLAVSLEDNFEGGAFRNSRSLAFAMGQFDSLKEFHIHTNAIITDTACIIEALAGHISLRELPFRAFEIGKEGITALAALLRNRYLTLRC